MPRYTVEMSRAVRQVRNPYPGKFLFDVVEYAETNQIGLRIYENNVMSFDVDRRVAIMEYLATVQKIIESFGVDCIYEGVKGDPPQR